MQALGITMRPTVAHLLWECPFARNVCALCRGKLQKCPNEAQDIFMLF